MLIVTSIVKEAGNSFQHFSNSYTLKGEYCHCLTSDATIMVSYKFPIIGKQVAVIILHNRLPSAEVRCSRYSGKTLHIALFISELAKRSSKNNIGVSSIESAVYAIEWGHAMAGIEACRFSHPLVKFALEGAKRRLADLISLRSRGQLTPLQAIATHFASSASLSDLRFLFILLVGFAGFFRIDEI